MLPIDLAGETLVLMPHGTAFLPAHGVLLVADAHFGKAASFRRAGVPVPQGTTSDTLARLSEAIAATAARQVVFLGDFLHARHAHAPPTLAALAAWRERHADVSLLLVRGNHDDRAGDPPASLAVRCVDEPWPLGPWLLCHHPQEHAAGYVLAGHLHPCVRLSGPGRDRLRLPCFRVGARVGVLPAFGAFTGMHPVDPLAGDRLYALAGDRVVPVPARA